MNNLGRVLRRRRINEEIGIREAAKQMGVSSATLLRIEQGKAVNASTMIRVLNWLIGEKS
jgi:transcriptional regulator with XRE-family HTH domain